MSVTDLVATTENVSLQPVIKLFEVRFLSSYENCVDYDSRA